MIFLLAKLALANNEIEIEPVLVFKKDKYLPSTENRIIQIVFREEVKIENIEVNFVKLTKKGGEYNLDKHTRSIIDLKYLVNESKTSCKELEIRLGKRNIKTLMDLIQSSSLQTEKALKGVSEILESNKNEIFKEFFRININKTIENIVDTYLKDILLLKFDNNFFDKSENNNLLPQRIEAILKDALDTYTRYITPELFYNTLIAEVSENITEKMKVSKECIIKYIEDGNKENNTHEIRKSTVFLHDVIFNCISKEGFIRLLNSNDLTVDLYITGILKTMYHKIKENINTSIIEATYAGARWRFVNLSFPDENTERNIIETIEYVSKISFIIRKYFEDYIKISFSGFSDFCDSPGMKNILFSYIYAQQEANKFSIGILNLTRGVKGYTFAALKQKLKEYTDLSQNIDNQDMKGALYRMMACLEACCKSAKDFQEQTRIFNILNDQSIAFNFLITFKGLNGQKIVVSKYYTVKNETLEVIGELPILKQPVLDESAVQYTGLLNNPWFYIDLIAAFVVLRGILIYLMNRGRYTTP